MFYHYLYYKDSYSEEKREEQGQSVSTSTVQALLQDREVESRSLTYCQGNTTLPVDSIASLYFPKRRYTAVVLVCSTIAEHILSFYYTVLCTCSFIHCWLGKRQNTKKQKTLITQQRLLPVCFSCKYSQKRRNSCLNLKSGLVLALPQVAHLWS